MVQATTVSHLNYCCSLLPGLPVPALIFTIHSKNQRKPFKAQVRSNYSFAQNPPVASHLIQNKSPSSGTSLVVQRLKLLSPNGGGVGSIPSWGLNMPLSTTPWKKPKSLQWPTGLILSGLHQPTDLISSFLSTSPCFNFTGPCWMHWAHSCLRVFFIFLLLLSRTVSPRLSHAPLLLMSPCQRGVLWLLFIKKYQAYPCPCLPVPFKSCFTLSSQGGGSQTLDRERTVKGRAPDVPSVMLEQKPNPGASPASLHVLSFKPPSFPAHLQVTSCSGILITLFPNTWSVEKVKRREDTSPYVLPASQNLFHWNLSWLSHAFTTRKDSESEWLARDNPETNSITIKPNTASHMAEQLWVPLPCCSSPGSHFPIKCLALSTRLSSGIIHF